MANKTFCDYCNREITSENEGAVELSLDGDPKDLCLSCSGKVKEALESLSKEK